MKNFTNLVGFSDSKLGYRVAKENLEFIDGKIISKEKISHSLTVTKLHCIGGDQHHCATVADLNK